MSYKQKTPSPIILQGSMRGVCSKLRFLRILQDIELSVQGSIYILSHDSGEKSYKEQLFLNSVPI